jgi:hypothetical protein
MKLIDYVYEITNATTVEQGEVAELEAENKQIDAINASLQAHITVLREALEVIADDSHEDLWQRHFANEVLASTPAQSLQAHDNEVIERCAEVMQMEGLGGYANAIRALKGKDEYR